MKTVLLWFLRYIIGLFDILLFPFYYLLDKPWRQISERDAQRANIVFSENEVILERIPKPKTDKCTLLKEIENILTVSELFTFFVQKFGNKRCLGTREILGTYQEKQSNGAVYTKLRLKKSYTWMNYIDVSNKVQSCGLGLKALGLHSGDKVALYSETMAQWLLAFSSCLINSFTVVTVYSNLGEEGAVYAINQTESKVVFCSFENLAKVLKNSENIPSLKNIIVFNTNKTDKVPESSTLEIITFDNLCKRGEQLVGKPPTVDSKDTAVIMYTSGSTGNPKGVILSHKNIMSAIKGLFPIAYEVIGTPKSNDIYIGYLPLAHVLELMFEFAILALGIPIGYSNANTLTNTSSMIRSGELGDASILKPTIWTCVPIILDRIYKGTIIEIKKKGNFSESLFHFFYEYKSKWSRRGFQSRLTNQLFFSKIKKLLGGHVRIIFCGGAPLTSEVHHFAKMAFDATLLVGYGLTETCGCAISTYKYESEYEKIGASLFNTKVKLIDWVEGGYTVKDSQGPRGEIVVGGEQIAEGYFDNEEETKMSFTESNGVRWIKTGDIGEVLRDGSLKVIDRKKDLVKLTTGEYVSLGKVESILKVHSVVDNICLIVDSTKNLPMALIIPNEVELRHISRDMNKPNDWSFKEICLDGDILTAVHALIREHGLKKKLFKFEIPGVIRCIDTPWTPESGHLTSALKLNRRFISETCVHDIQEMVKQLDHVTSVKESV